jgi:alkanesulfonate monooxygenase SsuD/methylene tetrahydromethanopterin reductase-like flavin-dependent oxidoreductase (luciferase family)
MKYGFVIPGGNAHEIVEMGVMIEEAGWDAAFGWETVYGLDPWVLLGAMAAQTSRVRLGTLLTPPSRRRPWKLAAEVATLDQLSNGRAVLIVGLGATVTGFGEVGEATDRKVRAERLDESLELIQHFWSGQPFKHSGKHYQVDWTSMSNWILQPVQQPRVPIWTVAMWPSERSMKRAYGLDGVLPFVAGSTEFQNAVTAEHISAIRAAATERKAVNEPFDIVIEGMTPIGDEEALEKVRTFASAGATWWVESMWEHPGGLDAVRERIKAGPPKM